MHYLLFSGMLFPIIASGLIGAYIEKKPNTAHFRQLKYIAIALCVFALYCCARIAYLQELHVL